MTNGPWYLLYGGSSEDGRGPGRYRGRTAEITEAKYYHKMLGEDPYTVGYVEIVTDSDIKRAYPNWPWPSA